jgi:CHAD domain-containing protein
MNDAIAAGNPTETTHYARKALKALDEKALKKEVRKFAPASHKSFEKEMDEQRGNLEAGLGKKTVLAPEFHEMRKGLTKVLAVLNLVPDVKKDPALAKLYTKVLTIQTEMGEMHDKLTAKAMRGEISYDTYEVTIPKRVRDGLREILDTLE